MKNGDGPIRLLLVEDDDLSREVLTLQMSAQGYLVDTATSGDDALLRLEQAQDRLPDAVLIDLHMPGTSGLELARRLRTLSSAPQSAPMLLLAMSASRPSDPLAAAYDDFLLKPFSMLQLAKALDGVGNRDISNDSPLGTDPGVCLDESVYLRLTASMSVSQLQQLYTLCVDDAEKRIARMRLAATRGDDPDYRKEAHNIKGGCGMVGAAELHRLAAAEEQSGILAANHVASLDEMLMACGRLRRILVARVERTRS